MNRFVIGTAVAILAGSIAVCVAIQRRAAAVLRERAQLVEQQGEAIANAAAENRRLSDLIDKLKTTQPLSRQENLELARLRNRVGEIRQIVAAKPGIEAANAHLQQVKAGRQKKLADAQAAPNYWPKEQLAYAGFATPEAALQSLLWTAQSGNLHAWESLCTTGALAGLMGEWNRHGLSPEQQQQELQTMGAALTSAATGFHIVSEQMTSPEDAVIDLSFDGEDAVRSFGLKKVGGDWKFDQMLFAGEAKRGQ